MHAPEAPSHYKLVSAVIVTRPGEGRNKRERCIEHLQTALTNHCFRKQSATLANPGYRKIFSPKKFCH